MLSKEQIDAFRRDGFLVAGNAVDAKQLAGLREVPFRWPERLIMRDLRTFSRLAGIAGST